MTSSDLSTLYAELYEEVLSDPSFLQLDRWQKDVLAYQGSVTIRAGRQVGKSTVVGLKASQLALKHPNITILMIAAAQRQSREIFSKTLANLYLVHEKLLKRAGGFKENPRASVKANQEARRLFEAKHGLFDGSPTRSEVRLKNGTRIISVPTGKTGAYIRTYAVDILIPDEAAFIPEPVWVAVKPMLAVSQKTKGLGWEILLSTPFGKGGYFYQACHDDSYRHFHISSENCPRITREFLQKEKARLSKAEYAQEYLGLFVDEFNQLFKTPLIKKCMTFLEWNPKTDKLPGARYFLGVDIARYGADETAYVIAEYVQKPKSLKIVWALTTERSSIVETVGFIKNLDAEWNFNRIVTDDSGLGGGVTDLLMEKLPKHKIIGINNASKADTDSGKGRIMKEDLYSYALTWMEAENHIHIIANLRLERSLKSITFKYTSDANLRIFGTYSHLAEAFVRALYGVKTKHLNLFLI